MVLAIEPLAARTCQVWADGWTLRTNDGSRAARVEHTVAITEDGPRVRTAREVP
ncbi:hypothetical protein GCM10010345_78220 [Streptomyces canarius]|uniref:Methionine aminopeptidase n=1 Tax=Streptomyces canarius TaxID=285453 RepID=A0ABQ3DA62_9ACTN|nr:hypothetical protein GCM10010345_78220 [Streptomyces canarius]